MKLCYGIEMKSVEHLHTNELEPLFQAIYEKVIIVDDDDELFIVQTENEAIKLMDLLKERMLFETLHTLYLVEIPKIESSFMDYGFKTESDNYYLYEDLIISFVINKGEDEQIKMALYQIEEDLIAADFLGDEIYFVDKERKQLIEGYAQAYQIGIQFREACSTNVVKQSKI